MSDEVLRQKLGLALPSDVVDTFLAMINRTVEFTATRPGVKPEYELKPEPLLTNRAFDRSVTRKYRTRNRN